MMNKAVFACHTIYQTFIAYVIKITEYEDMPCALLIEGNNNCEEVAQRSIESGLWESVCIYNMRSESDDQIIKWINANNLTDCEFLHLGAWGGRVANILSNMISDETTVVIDEEGTASYSWLDGYNKWVERYYVNRGLKYANQLRLDRIKKSYLFDTRISDNQLGIEEKNIDIEKFVRLFKDKYIDTFNYVFGYKKTTTSGHYVFFDQNLYLQKVAGDDFQKCLISILSKMIYPEKLLFKQHPSESLKPKTKGIENVIVDNNRLIPWELTLLNSAIVDQDYSECTYITYCSSAAINGVIIGKILGKKIRSVLLYELVNSLSKNKILLDENVIARYQNYYGGLFFVPHSFVELTNSFGLEENTDAIIAKWFSDFYFDNFEKIESCNLFGKEQRDNFPSSGKVVIYGAGSFGKETYEKNKQNASVQIVGWVDKDYKNKVDSGEMNVQDPAIVVDVEYEYIYLAVKSIELRNDIKRYLITLGVDMSKIREPKI